MGHEVHLRQRGPAGPRIGGRSAPVLMVDETAMRRRHRYVTVLQNGETGEVLAMVAYRNAAALSGFLIEQGPRWCRGVQVVVSDGSKSTRPPSTPTCPARLVLDRFHVVRWFAASLTLVRRNAQRRQPPGVKPVFDPTCSEPVRAAPPGRRARRWLVDLSTAPAVPVVEWESVEACLDVVRLARGELPPARPFDAAWSPWRGSAKADASGR